MKRLERLLKQYRDASQMSTEPEAIATILAAAEISKELAKLRTELKQQADGCRNFLGFLEDHLAGQ